VVVPPETCRAVSR